MAQAPGKQGTTQATSRVLTRGNLEFFVFQFFYDTALTLPVAPYDPLMYPSFKIMSPEGSLIAQGVAVVGSITGEWKVGWVVPKDASLNTVNKRYTFQTVMVDAELRQFETSFEFDVVESAIPAQEPELQQLATLVGKSLRVFFKNTVRPVSLNVVVVPRGQDANILHSANFTFPPPLVFGPNDLHEYEEGTHYVYYTDTPPFASTGLYSAIWSVRDNPIASEDFEHQSIEIVATTTMHMVKSVRMLIDKLQKKLGIVYAYRAEDMLEYVRQGMGLVNSYWPPTNFTPNDAPASLEAYITLAAAWWGLNAQRILYAETNFSFSGQTVTLEYNPGADIDSVITNFKEYLDTNLSNVKKQLVRSSRSVGAVSTRPMSRGGSTPVVKIGSGHHMHQFMHDLGIF